MKFFDKWVARQCLKAWNNAKTEADDYEKVPESVNGISKRRARVTKPTKNESESIDDLSCYTFKMQPAEGGTIVQIIHYIEQNNQAGAWIKDLYIIPETKDLGEELMSILVQYKLKHQ
jgi:hypothetical protein